MRGKLRDKPATTKWNRLKREAIERRRPPKRESRNAILLYQRLEEEDYPQDGDEEVKTTESK